MKENYDWDYVYMMNAMERRKVDKGILHLYIYPWGVEEHYDAGGIIIPSCSLLRPDCDDMMTCILFNPAVARSIRIRLV